MSQELIDKPLAGRSAVTWRDGSRAECCSLQDVIDVGLPAVVSITELTDFENEAELHELLPVALKCEYIEYIVVTARWVNTDVGKCNLPGLKRLAALANVSLCMITTHTTRLVNVKGASICWDYTCGTPTTVPYAKSPITGDRLPLRGFVWIGPQDWAARTKAARAVPPTAAWHDFVRHD